MGNISGGSARRNYYVQGQGIGLDDFTASGNERVYNARITSNSADKNDTRWHSDEELHFEAESPTEFPAKGCFGKDESQENILPARGGEKGITKTVHVSLERS